MKEFKKIYLFDLQTGKKIVTDDALTELIKRESRLKACSVYLDTNIISLFYYFYNKRNEEHLKMLSEFNRINKIKHIDLIGFGASLEYAFNKQNMAIEYDKFNEIENYFNRYINNGFDPFKNKSLVEDKKQIESFKVLLDSYLKITYVLFLKIIDIDRRDISFFEKVQLFFYFMNRDLQCLSSYELIIACDIFCENTESSFKKIIKKYNQIKQGKLNTEDTKRELLNASWDIFHLRLAEQLYLFKRPDIKNNNKEPYLIFATLDKEFSNLINSRTNAINILNEHNFIEFNKLNNCMQKDFDKIFKLQIQECIFNEPNRVNKYSDKMKEDLENVVFNFSEVSL